MEKHAEKVWTNCLKIIKDIVAELRATMGQLDKHFANAKTLILELQHYLLRCLY